MAASTWLGLEGVRGARRAAGDREAAAVELVDECLAVDVEHTEGGDVGQSVGRRSDDLDVRESRGAARILSISAEVARSSTSRSASCWRQASAAAGRGEDDDGGAGSSPRSGVDTGCRFTRVPGRTASTPQGWAAHGGRVRGIRVGAGWRWGPTPRGREVDEQRNPAAALAASASAMGCRVPISWLAAAGHRGDVGSGESLAEGATRSRRPPSPRRPRRRPVRAGPGAWSTAVVTMVAPTRRRASRMPRRPARSAWLPVGGGSPRRASVQPAASTERAVSSSAAALRPSLCRRLGSAHPASSAARKVSLAAGCIGPGAASRTARWKSGSTGGHVSRPTRPEGGRCTFWPFTASTVEGCLGASARPRRPRSGAAHCAWVCFRLTPRPPRGEHGQFVNGFLPQGVTEGADRSHDPVGLVLDRPLRRRLPGVGPDHLVHGAHRRLQDDNELPVQLRYNVPIEILYTVVPIFMIATFFYYTRQGRGPPARHLGRAGREHQRRGQAVELGLQLRR